MLFFTCFGMPQYCLKRAFKSLGLRLFLLLTDISHGIPETEKFNYLLIGQILF